MLVTISEVECYLKDRYGIESILDDKKKVILDFLKCNVKSNEWKRFLDKFILDIDIRQYFTGKDLKLIEEQNYKNLLVMVVKFVDCSKSKKQLSSETNPYNDESDCDNEKNTRHNFGDNSSNRLYNLTLTTGKLGINNNQNDVTINCIEYEKIKSFNDQSLLPGTKLLLSNNVLIVNSIILLNNSNHTYLGGTVKEMIESWKLTSLLTTFCSRKIINSRDASNKPPKFVPFVNKNTNRVELINEVINAENRYGKTKEATNKENKFEKETEKQVSLDSSMHDLLSNYEDFILKISEQKSKNINNKLNIFDKLTKVQCVDKPQVKSEKKKTKNYSTVSEDPGAPVKMYRGRLQHEIIDSDAKQFITTREKRSNISLFDHLVSKLSINDSNKDNLPTFYKSDSSTKVGHHTGKNIQKTNNGANKKTTNHRQTTNNNKTCSNRSHNSRR